MYPVKKKFQYLCSRRLVETQYKFGGFERKTFLLNLLASEFYN
jgi:hypothetical protein